MKAIMISIQPQWVSKILNKEKLVEIRKTMPKCELPCKVYIYCTKSKPTLQYFYNWQNYKPVSKHSTWASGRTLNVGEYGNGRVVAEFTLNKVDTIEICDPCVLRNGEQQDWHWFKSNACLDSEQIMSYIGYGNDHDGWGNEYAKGYAWHIDNLKIYDKPKELSEFSHYIPNNKCPKKECGIDCEDCMSYDGEHETCLALYYSHWQIKRPPQSWCYVEELEDE